MKINRNDTQEIKELLWICKNQHYSVYNIEKVAFEEKVFEDEKLFLQVTTSNFYILNKNIPQYWGFNLFKMPEQELLTRFGIVKINENMLASVTHGNIYCAADEDGMVDLTDIVSASEKKEVTLDTLEESLNSMVVNKFKKVRKCRAAFASYKNEFIDCLWYEETFKSQEMKIKDIETSISNYTHMVSIHTDVRDVNEYRTKLVHYKEAHRQTINDMNYVVKSLENARVKRKDCFDKLIKLMKVEDEVEEKKIDIKKEDLENILKHKMVKRVSLSSSNLYILTENIYITEYNDNTFDIGEIEINVGLSDGDVVLDNITRAISTNTWGDSAHPHCSQGGRPCFGNASERLLYFFNEKEMYAYFLSMLQYLEGADIYDAAGRFLYRWPEVKWCEEVGTYVEVDEDERYVPKESMCSDCEYEGGELYTCYRCDAVVCDGCSRYVDSEQETICHNCLEECYTYCDNCNEYYSDDNNYAHIEFFGYACEDCLANYFTMCNSCGGYERNDSIQTTHDGRSICGECVDEKYVACADCGMLVLEDDALEDAKGDIFCPDCHKEDEEEESEEKKVVVVETNEPTPSPFSDLLD